MDADLHGFAFIHVHPRPNIYVEDPYESLQNFEIGFPCADSFDYVHGGKGKGTVEGSVH
jgi:hypothetical protein